MRLKLDLVTDILWLVPLILQSAIVLVMIRRKLVPVFPFFFSYTALIVCTAIVLIFFPYNHGGYSLIYWSSETLAILLEFAVILEILRHILPSAASVTFLLNAVAVLAAFAAVVAVMILVSAKTSTGTDLLEDVVLAERCLRFLQASLLIVVIALMSALGLTWHQESLGIIAGFGVYAVVALAVYEFGFHLNWMSPSAYTRLNSAGYNVAALIWAFYILCPRRRPPVDRLPDGELAEWNVALNSYLNEQAPRR